MSDQNVFNEKIVIMTGGASGIGREMALQMARSGATLVLADIDEEGVRKTAADIEAAGGKAQANVVDTTDFNQVEALVDGTVAEHGRLDFIFNNAGIAVGGEVDKMPIEHWDKIIDINVKGVVYGTSAAYKHMAKQRSGHIVNTASLAGIVPSPMLSPYSTTKFAVVGLCESLRPEAAQKNVKVTALCPGFIESQIYDNSLLSGDVAKQGARATIPVKFVTTEKGSEMLLKGVAANKAIVTLPFYGHLLWRSYRFNMPLHRRLSVFTSKLAIKRARKAANKTG